MRLDLTDAPDAAVGDEVVLIGVQGDACIAPEDVIERNRLGRVTTLAMQVRSTILRRYIEAPSTVFPEGGA